MDQTPLKWPWGYRAPLLIGHYAYPSYINVYPEMRIPPLIMQDQSFKLSPRYSVSLKYFRQKIVKRKHTLNLVCITMFLDIPSSNTDTTTPLPVIPCIQAGSTFKSLPDDPAILPVFNCISQKVIWNFKN